MSRPTNVELVELELELTRWQRRLGDVLRERREVIIALQRVLLQHCPDDRICPACTPARELLRRLEEMR